MVVVVVALVWWIISSVTGGGDGDSDEASPSAATETSEVSEASEASGTSEPSATSGESSAASSEASESSASTEEPSESAEASESEEPSDVPEEIADKTTCELDDLQLTVRPGAPTFRDGQQPNFFLEVTNPTSGECDIDLSEDELRFEVFTMDAGYTRVWGDTDCNEPTSSGNLELEAKQSRTYEMTGWSRTTSSPDSCSNREPVDNGAYMVYGHIGDNTSESQTFNLA